MVIIMKPGTETQLIEDVIEKVEDLEAIIEQLPAFKRPTVSPLANGEWVAVETIVDSALVRELIPRLKAAGAQGIIEYPLNKMIM